MKFISCSTTYLPFLCKALGFSCGSQAQCVVCVDENGGPIAGVLYDGYNGAIIHAHIWVDAEKVPSREWYAAIFDYPFNQLMVTKIIGQVSSANIEAQRLDTHFGFELEAQISNYYEDGSSLMVYTMDRSQCKVLNSPKWAGVVKKVKGTS